MHFAAENGDIEMMKLLKAHGGDYEVEDKELATPIFYACRMNKLDTIKWLDSLGVDLEHREFQDRTILYV